MAVELVVTDGLECLYGEPSGGGEAVDTSIKGPAFGGTGSTGGTTSGTSSGTTSGTTSGTSSGTTGGTGGGGCTASMHIDNQWDVGFTATVTVTAGSSAINGWTVGWNWPGNQQETSAWSATVTQAGAAVTATNLSYDGAVAAGGSTTFGLQGTASATFPLPTLTCTAS